MMLVIILSMLTQRHKETIIYYLIGLFNIDNYGNNKWMTEGLVELN